MNARFLARKVWKEEELALRIAEIVVGDQKDHYKVYKKETGSWQLDSANNWFMQFDAHTCECEVQHRYASNTQMIALQTVLQWLLGSPT